MCGASSSPKASRIRARSWLELSSPGVEQQVGPLAHRLEQPALVGDRLLDTAGRQRVAPPRALVAAHQHVVGGVEEDDPHPRARSAAARRARRAGRRSTPGPVLAAAAADDQRHPLDPRAGPVHQLDHLRDQRGRQVVDDEPAQVLEGRRRRRAARPRHPRHHERIRSSPPQPCARRRRRPDRRRRAARARQELLERGGPDGVDPTRAP